MFEKHFIAFSVAFIILLILFSIPLIASSDAPPPNAPVINPTPVLEPYKPSQGHIEELVTHYCPIEQRSVALLIIKAESSFNSRAVGDNGNSFGLVQIHRPSHPHITQEQAFDVHFSVKFLCDNLVAGRGSMWTTYPVYRS